tara:strand:+ start:420 stop:644 length:225 start_codon:yes stop_codon:yes gene_type:complete
MHVCGIYFFSGHGGSATDATGCLLKDGHVGPHEFSEASGKVWQWETDMNCDCEHCQRCDGDYCSTYWKKKISTE